MMIVMIHHANEEAIIRRQLSDGLDKLREQNKKYKADHESCSEDLIIDKQAMDDALKVYEPVQAELKAIESSIKECQAALKSK